jgi:hypothetical protein
MGQSAGGETAFKQLTMTTRMNLQEIVTTLLDAKAHHTHETG